MYIYGMETNQWWWVWQIRIFFENWIYIYLKVEYSFFYDFHVAIMKYDMYKW